MGVSTVLWRRSSADRRHSEGEGSATDFPLPPTPVSRSLPSTGRVCGSPLGEFVEAAYARPPRLAFILSNLSGEPTPPSSDAYRSRWLPSKPLTPANGFFFFPAVE